MNTLLRPALTLFGLLTILTGVVYPLAVTAVAQLAFSEQANGSLIRRGERVVGCACWSVVHGSRVFLGPPFGDFARSL